MFETLSTKEARSLNRQLNLSLKQISDARLIAVRTFINTRREFVKTASRAIILRCDDMFPEIQELVKQLKIERPY